MADTNQQGLLDERDSCYSHACDVTRHDAQAATSWNTDMVVGFSNESTPGSVRMVVQLAAFGLRCCGNAVECNHTCEG